MHFCLLSFSFSIEFVYTFLIDELRFIRFESISRREKNLQCISACFLFHFPSDSFTLFLILNFVSFDSSQSRKGKRIYNAFLLVFFSIFHWIRLHFFNRQTWLYSIRADLEKEKESTMHFCLLSFPLSIGFVYTFLIDELRFIRFEPRREKKEKDRAE